jgi:polyhydroxybutyrate depolymerase
MTKIHSLLIIFSLALTISCSQDDDASNSISDQNDTSFTFSKSLIIDGNKRDYILYIPKNHNSSTKTPLVINFHGFGGEANNFMNYADMRKLADDNQFILIYPQGAYSDGFSSWNPCPIGGDNKSSSNDFGFVEKMIDTAANEYNVDRSRVYAIGYSNGGMMAYGLAHHKSNLIAAIASVSGTMLECYGQTEHPMPLLNIHGTSDNILPYQGNESYSSAQADLDFWIEFNNASATPTVNSDSSGRLTIEHYVYSNTSAPVEHYKHVDGKHVWFNKTYQNKNTAEIIWEFVSRFKLN